MVTLAALLFRVSLTPLMSFAPVDLKANIVVGEGRGAVAAQMDCDNGYFSSSAWDRADRIKNLTFKIRQGGKCTLTVVVYDEMDKVVGMKRVEATVIGRDQ